MTLHFRLVHREARHRAQLAIAEAPEGWIATIKPPTRSLEQNALIHAVLTEAGELTGWTFNGQKVDLEDMKSIFMAAYRKASGQESRFAIGIDGQPVILNWRTRDLSKQECTEFVDMVQAWMAQRATA